MEYLSPQGVLLPRAYSTTASPLWLELRGPAAWQAKPSWAVCRHACHPLLLWLRVTFSMVPDAAWPGWDQRPWSTAPATRPVGQLGRPSASDPGGVDRCVLSLCCPRCKCACGILALAAPVHRCARCVRCVCAVGGCVPPPGRAPVPGRPTPRQEAPPQGALVPRPQRAKPGRKSARCGVGDGSPRRHPPHPQPVGGGPRPHARKDEWLGVGERPTPDAPHLGKRCPPRAPLCRPYSTQERALWGW